MRLADKTAIVTGAAQGIGRAIAERFAAEGARLVIVDRQGDALESLAAALGPNAIALVGSVTDPDMGQRLVSLALERFGAVDILVNNAVSYTEVSLETCTDEEWLSTIDGALTSVFRACRAALKPMLAAGRGSIVNLGSINQIVANPRLPAYTAAKGGIRALTKQIAVEYGPRGIRCNCLSPGLILTERTRAGRAPEDWRVDAEAYPLGRVGTPEEVAAAALFLASDEASFITGVDLPIDGGLTSLAASALLSPKVRGWWGRAPITLPEV